ncbi:uncharacterized protein B0J16DRAFT_330795 [Fusarium flagelliforme]|uniref:uncharacterized protein n=1 Tax=Fusarium flagelliforme TaxID=2675880 RepID=UPI001E8EF0C6|nr:uncharacterized protein B0J16DRAFT_330795 [Fusarium flagelliforme]KAH7198649.1 hypothetical protein B0J16DRAFT_330795 [Fusarium flagelliforme]
MLSRYAILGLLHLVLTHSTVGDAMSDPTTMAVIAIDKSHVETVEECSLWSNLLGAYIRCTFTGHISPIRCWVVSSVVS